MKKSYFFKNFLVSILFSFTFISCQNFFSGDSLVSQINDEIENANAPYIEFEMQKGLGGSVSPIGKQSVKCKTEFTISYEKENDFQFIEWQFFVDNVLLSEEDLKKYILVSDKEKELVTVKFLLEIPGKLVIKPLCYERPVILSKTPTETPEGSYRDARISVLFSKPMDESSIYFDSDEIPSGAVPKYTEKTNKIYAYSLDEEIYFKNIEIKNIDTQENLLESYDAPYFESPTKLCIPVIKNKEPKSGSQILVSISRKMCLKTEDRPVYLSKNEIWNYFVNTKIDRDVPLFESIELKKYDFKSEDLKNLNHIDVNGSFTEQQTKDLYINNNYVGVNVKCMDLGSGLNSAYLKLQQVYDSNYNAVVSSTVSELPLPLTYTSGKNKAVIYEGLSDSSKPFGINLSDIENGVYKVWLKILDVNGNCIESINDETLPEEDRKYFYILKTNTAIDVNSIKTIPQNNGLKITLSDRYSSFIKKAVVTYSNKTNRNIEQNITAELDADEIQNGRFILNGLQNGSFYDFKVTFTDHFENKTSKIISKEVMTAPAAPVITKVGIYNGPEVPSEVIIFNINGEGFGTNEVTDYYGRGVEFKEPAVLSEYTLKYKVYDGDTVIQKNITSTGFDLAYSETEGKKSYRMASYIEVDGETVEGPKSNAFTYYERNVDGVFIDTVLSTKDRFGIVAGVIVSQNNNKAGSDHRFKYGRWERYFDRNGTQFSNFSNKGTNFTTSPLTSHSGGYYFYFRRDVCVSASVNSSYVYRMKRAESDQDNDILLGFTFKKDYDERDVQFLWDGYTVK